MKSSAVSVSGREVRGGYKVTETTHSCCVANLTCLLALQVTKIQS